MRQLLRVINFLSVITLILNGVIVLSAVLFHVSAISFFDLTLKINKINLSTGNVEDYFDLAVLVLFTSLLSIGCVGFSRLLDETATINQNKKIRE